jgi:hypothetical protein
MYRKQCCQSGSASGLGSTGSICFSTISPELRTTWAIYIHFPFSLRKNSCVSCSPNIPTLVILLSMVLYCSSKLMKWKLIKNPYCIYVLGHRCLCIWLHRTECEKRRPNLDPATLNKTVSCRGWGYSYSSLLPRFLLRPPWNLVEQKTGRSSCWQSIKYRCWNIGGIEFKSFIIQD